MATPWRWLSAEAAEQALLVDVDTTLRLPQQPAAPPNRLRRVLRLDAGGRPLYLKVYRRTQWKNRLRQRLSAPRAADDAEREAAMTQLLRQAGIEAPRPLATARTADGTAYYLCAPLPGRPLRDLLGLGLITPTRARLVASFCGDVLQQGFWLPDLSADHLYVRLEIAFLHFGLLDLHNGSRGRPGPPPRRLLLRVLRHFARSVRELRLPWPHVLRFAVRLLRAAGRGGEARALLRRLPPFDTARRYQARGKAGAYGARDPDRHRRELALLRRVWPGRSGELVLDCPSGTGRLLPMLQDGNGHRLLWADAALAMLQEARLGLVGAPPCLQADLLRLPLQDGSVDGAVLFRFLHHLEPAALREAVAEACRVARRFVVVSFFHPCSAHALSRRLSDLLHRRAPTRHAVTLRRLRRLFGGHGFAPGRHAAELPYLRDLWVAAFVREGSG